MPGWANGVTVSGGYAYVAYGDRGLQIFQYYGVGVEENPVPQASSRKPAATVIRTLKQGAVAFDAMGKRALTPRAGIYFVREGQSQAQAQAVRKLVVTK
jgi:hypothetical protein